MRGLYLREFTDVCCTGIKQTAQLHTNGLLLMIIIIIMIIMLLAHGYGWRSPRGGKWAQRDNIHFAAIQKWARC